MEDGSHLAEHSEARRMRNAIVQGDRESFGKHREGVPLAVSWIIYKVIEDGTQNISIQSI
jgi:hypothetical protein